MVSFRFIFRFACLFCLSTSLWGCQPAVTAVVEVTETAVPPTPTSTVTQTVTATTELLPSPAVVVLPTYTSEPTATATETAVPTDTPLPTETPSPTATLTPTLPVLVVPTLTPIVHVTCIQADPDDADLLPLVTKRYGLSAGYEPGNLVALSDHFDHKITLGYPTRLREIALEPLKNMIADMQGAGLAPFIISGYRSHNTQRIAFEKWLILEPERAAQLSAPPGHSEHQLGTTVDFGSPVLQEYVETELKSQFHTNFYLTPEGTWLLENAHNYGFALSYPREAAELTGFFYEPWHYRYVGVETATQLKEMGISLTAYQLANFEPPCVLQSDS